MYRKYRIVESIANSVSQYESYRDQVYRYTPSGMVSYNCLSMPWIPEGCFRNKYAVSPV